MMRTRWLVLAPIVLCAPRLAAAQGESLTLRGQVRDSAARPIPGAFVEARRDAQRIVARADTAGRYELVGLSPGAWRLVVRQLGYRPDSSTLRIAVGDLREIVSRDIVLRRVLIQLDERVVRGVWTGVRGVVGTRDLRPIAGAKITVVGESRVERSDERGEFAFPWIGGRSVLLRIEATDFRTRLVGVTIPEGPSPELAIFLESAEGWRPNLIIADDLERRLNWAAPNAAYVSREDLLRRGTRDAKAALEGTADFNLKGLVIERDACVFVDGVAKPGIPLDAIDISTIEFIEVYPAASERTGTLARRWPRGAPCGAPVDRAFKRWVPEQIRVRYVSVWTRQAEPRGTATTPD